MHVSYDGKGVRASNKIFLIALDAAYKFTTNFDYSCLCGYFAINRGSLPTRNSRAVLHHIG